MLETLQLKVFPCQRPLVHLCHDSAADIQIFRLSFPVDYKYGKYRALEVSPHRFQYGILYNYTETGIFFRRKRKFDIHSGLEIH